MEKLLFNMRNMPWQGQIQGGGALGAEVPPPLSLLDFT